MPPTKKTLVALLKPTSQRGDALAKQSLTSLLALTEERGLTVQSPEPAVGRERSVVAGPSAVPPSKKVLIALLKPTNKRGDALAKRSPASLLALARERGLEIPPHEKRKRPDVAVRKACGKDRTISVVKMCLSKFSFDAGKALPIQNAVDRINMLTREAYMLANMHVLRLLEAKLPIPPLDQSFCYRCLCSVSRSPGLEADEGLATTARRYRQVRSAQCELVDRSNLNGFLQDASLSMATAVKNHVSTNLYSRLRRHLRVRLDIDGVQAYRILKEIFERSRMVEAPNYRDDAAARRSFFGGNFVARHFSDLMPLPPTDRNMQSHPEAFMRVMFELARYSDAHTHLKGVRCFSLLPHTDGYTCKYVKIGNLGLRSLLSAACVDVPPEDAWTRVAEAHWRRLFNVGRLETENRKFAGEVLTDGKAVSVVLQRPKRADDAEPIKLRPEDFDQVWGLDPGMRDMFVATDNAGETLRCSSAEFYNDASYTASNRKQRVWRDKDPVVAAIERNMPTKKTVEVVRLEACVTYVTRHTAVMMRFYGAQRFKNLKFRRYCASKRKLHQLVAALARHGKRTLVGFGNWSIARGGVIKGCTPGPSGRLRKELQRHATVMDVDEFRTSKTCNCCKQRSFEHMVLTTVDEETGARSRRKLHSVLHCKTSDCLSMTVNRDVNASRNILELTLAQVAGRPRPACFCRGDGDD